MPMSRPTGSDHSARRALSVRSKLFDWCRAGHLSRVDRRRRQRRRGSAIAKRYVSKMVGLTPEPGRWMGVVNGDQKVAKSGKIARLWQGWAIPCLERKSGNPGKSSKKPEKSSKKVTFWAPKKVQKSALFGPRGARDSGKSGISGSRDLGPERFSVVFGGSAKMGFLGFPRAVVMTQIWGIPENPQKPGFWRNPGGAWGPGSGRRCPELENY